MVGNATNDFNKVAELSLRIQSISKNSKRQLSISKYFLTLGQIFYL